MDYRIEKKIKFNDETKHKSLYEWCLNEIGDDGKVGDDLSPWHWSFSFTASDLRVIRRVEIGKIYDQDERRRGTTETITIAGDLFSGSCLDGENLVDITNFSMFGTDRVIKKFDLNIYEADDGEDENCSLWGSPSYEIEIDFSHDITDDDVVVNLHLNTKRFSDFVRLIESKQVDYAFVRLSEISGFYSEWSPSIRTSEVKVLTSSHDIEGLEGKEIEPPKLGSVNEFVISLYSINNLKAKFNREPVDFYKQFEDTSDYEEGNFRVLESIGFKQERIDSNPSKEMQLALYAKLVNSLKIPLWLILIALLLLLAK